MRKLMNQKIALQHGKCALCGEKFTDYNDVVPDHISPRGMDGAWRDDHPDYLRKCLLPNSLELWRVLLHADRPGS